ncbi:MAG: 3-phosphoshikimate 1-carboxyvinyltransferase [Candidatus Binatia bacterium]|nr:MAG: 3-phosphoshikimate 1-carboxyvinyltransferase [Candidatus Binatia bacterium]
MNAENIYWVRPLTRPINAVVTVPGSKSITNRALLLAALARGASTLEGALFSDDTEYMARAWQVLGIDVQEDREACRFVVRGGDGTFPAREADLFVGNAGTAMRFLVAALCLGHGRFRIDGSPRMRERPIQPLLDTLCQLGADAMSERGTGCPPVVVRAHGLRGGRASLEARQSSQFLSAVLQVAPCTQQGVELHRVGPLIAEPYVAMTIGVMQAFGAVVETDGRETFRVMPQAYKAAHYRIEPDASSAHYFWAAAALCGGRVRVPGLNRRSLQGDVRFAEVLGEMGAQVEFGENFVEVRGTGELRGIDVDMNPISDTAMTLAALAPFATGPVRIRNVAHLRIQESDRLRAMTTELARLGVKVEEREDGLSVYPSAIAPAVVDTYGDHRIAMSLALIGLRVGAIGIRDPHCVRKTFPEFFTKLEALYG